MNGTAYGFFDCDASQNAIEAELPSIRAVVKSPKSLNLHLTDGTSNVVTGYALLKELVDRAQNANMRYMIEAELPRASNEQAATAFVAVLNQAYQSPLFDTNEPFRGEIAFEENGTFHYRD